LVGFELQSEFGDAGLRGFEVEGGTFEFEEGLSMDGL